MNIRQISVSTPEVLWHGGGNENGKPDPVYSVDFHPQEEIMCTSGIDANVPPKGSVRVWRVSSHNSDQEFLIDLCDHQSAINVAKFSPDGKMLASASERQIVVYIVPDPSSWLTVADIAPLERIWLRPSLNEVFDMQWSPDSTHLIVGAIDCKAEIIRISTRDSVILPGHSSYIQGVAWDPLGEHVVTQSADRSCKVHKIKSKPGSTVKLAGKGHVVMRMQLGYSIPDAEKKVLTAADFGVQDGAAPTEATPTAGQTNVNLFADSFVPSFFRRISWSPDGALIIAPTGIHRPIEAKTGTAGLPGSSYCTHIFSRANLSSPCVSLAGLEEPSVAVRCCPRPYRLVSHAGQDTPAAMIPGEYRLVFAVVTLGSVFVYDTQHSHPIAKFSGLHYAPINDAAWSADGRMLAVCSSDGYLSFFRFEEGALGQLLCEEDIPVQIKRAHPCMFHYTPPAIEAPTVNAPTSTTTELNTKQTHSSEEDNINTTVSVVPSVDVIPVAPVLVVPADAAVVADFTADTKKRKRIQPVVVGALGSATSAAPVDAAVSTASPILSSPSAKPCPSQSPPVPVSAKKRIVPQLVQPASNNSPLPADSSDKTTGVSTSTSITITTPTTTTGSGDGTDQKQVSS